MKSWLFEYINFLLFSHNCVVVPDLGAFVKNEEPAGYGESLMAPSMFLTFNQDIRHNDGILQAFYKEKEGVSYELALKQIKDAVAKIKFDLKQGHKVVCAKIGYLSLNENNTIYFEPNENYVYPDFIGLERVHLMPLALFEEEQPEKMRKKKPLGYIAAAVAAALFFITPSVDVRENSSEYRSQKADISLSLKNALLGTDSNLDKISVLSSDPVIASDEAVSLFQAQKTGLRTYYIIIGSETSKQRSKILHKRFLKDFSEVLILESSERYRFSVASFDDKQIAEDYLLNFRKEYPKYKNAWLLSKRNK